MAEIVKAEEKTAYRSIFKATSLFGGVKIFEIIISILKSKIVAILIGPAGVGFNGLLASGISLIQSATQFGLGQSAVRDVSESYGSGNQERINRTITALRKLVWITGLLGMLCMIVFSPLLSKSSFGNYDYIWAFVCISVVLLCHQLTAGQSALLQGTRKLKLLAKSSIIGQIIGFIVCIPMYYFWGMKGVIPVVIIGAFTSLTLSWHFARKVEYKPIPMTFKEVLKEGGSMLKLGIAMSLSSILVALTSYLLRSFISNRGGLEEVGLFQAGFAIMTSYVGLVFSAMATDYFPRLSSVNKDNEKCRALMNQQGEIGILILAPLMVICVIFIQLIVWILYSDKFLASTGYICWAAAGMLFKMGSWAVSFIFVAKGETKIFMVNETVTNIYSLGFQVLGYWLMGLEGVGIGFSLSFLVYFVQVYVLAHKRYGFTFTKDFLQPMYLQSLLLGAAIALTFIIQVEWVKYTLGTVIILVSVGISLSGLDKRMGLISAIKDRIKK